MMRFFKYLINQPKKLLLKENNEGNSSSLTDFVVVRFNHSLLKDHELSNLTLVIYCNYNIIRNLILR